MTFTGTPNMLVRLMKPIGKIKYFRFNEEGLYTTENERLAKRLSHKFEQVAEKHSCKKCEFVAENKGSLLSHYRSEHPKEET